MSTSALSLRYQHDATISEAEGRQRLREVMRILLEARRRRLAAASASPPTNEKGGVRHHSHTAEVLATMPTLSTTNKYGGLAHGSP
jgi:hypothetical protein